MGNLGTFMCADCKGAVDVSFTLATQNFRTVTFACCLYCKVNKGDPRSLRAFTTLDKKSWWESQKNGLPIVAFVQVKEDK